MTMRMGIDETAKYVEPAYRLETVHVNVVRRAGVQDGQALYSWKIRQKDHALLQGLREKGERSEIIKARIPCISLLTLCHFRA